MSGAPHVQNLSKSSRVTLFAHHIDELILWVLESVGKKSLPTLLGLSWLIKPEIFDDNLQTSDTETSIVFNFAVLKLKQAIKNEKSMRNSVNQL